MIMLRRASLQVGRTAFRAPLAATTTPQLAPACSHAAFHVTPARTQERKPAGFAGTPTYDSADFAKGKPP